MDQVGQSDDEDVYDSDCPDCEEELAALPKGIPRKLGVFLLNDLGLEPRDVGPVVHDLVDFLTNRVGEELLEVFTADSISLDKK